MTRLSIYGENGFTFQFFDNLARRERIERGGVRELLGNLKRVDDGKKKFPSETLNPDSDAEIWLFPGFGKRDGFGEPDAILLIDRHAFWFEVETRVDLAASSLRHQLRQLFRFHCAARAFATQRGDDGICRGPTISNHDEIKAGALILDGHHAAELVDALGNAREHHFVLFSVETPKGDGAWRENLPSVVNAHISEWNTLIDPVPPMLLSSTWYVYWERDLNRQKFGWPDLTKGYVPIK